MFNHYTFTPSSTLQSAPRNEVEFFAQNMINPAWATRAPSNFSVSWA